MAAHGPALAVVDAADGVHDGEDGDLGRTTLAECATRAGRLGAVERKAIADVGRAARAVRPGRKATGPRRGERAAAQRPVTVGQAFVLDLASRCGISADDRRVRELVSYSETRRRPYGLWQHPTHPQLSRWLTFELECSLRRLAAGDWIGTEAPAPSTLSNNPRRRY